MQNCRFKWHEIVKIKHFCVVLTSASAGNFRSADLNTQTQTQPEQNKNDENLIFLVVSVSKASELASVIHPTNRSFAALNHFLRLRRSLVMTTLITRSCSAGGEYVSHH